MAERTVNVAFCGCGAIARRHAAVLQTLGADVIACWNPPGHYGSAESLAVQTSARYVTDDLHQVADDPGIEAVYVCNWHHERVAMLEVLAAAGKAVFMEKPLALGLDDLAQMKEIVRRHGIHFHAGYKTRFNSGFSAARSRVPHPEAMVVHVFDRAWPPGSRGADPLVGGGHIRAQGVYGLEVAYLVANAPPVAMAAVGSLVEDRATSMGSIACSIEFGNGVVASVMISDGGVASSSMSKFFLEMAGDGEFASLTERFTRLCHRDRSGTEVVLDFPEDGFRRQSEVFLDNVRHGRPSGCSVEEGMVPSIMALAAIESANTGRRVKIELPAAD